MKQNLHDLIDYVNEIGLQYRTVPDKLTRDFVGMNPEAAKSFGYNIPKNTIHVDNNLTIKTKRHTLAHEIVEYLLMKHKGLDYWDAHKIALKWERKPVRDIIEHCEKIREKG